MSLQISPDKGNDPFAKPYQECNKCGGRLALRIEGSASGTQKTTQVCRKCGHTVLTSQVNIVRVK